ncbi:ADP-ribosylglycohydrolase family protein [Lactiplantibacillus plantarum]|uniref:ADP-ribosylglycohydrolase family protein n=1 Tax=Lactiplantibacillus plantarum TaxID=1590 RepID=UPI0020C0F9BD|nr:ADP-ribosylglycohydrolase family protein [Lactiplantibacillus plantarum]MCK8448892.1 ADP-ribosylglycohydrolase family protein [Lactiplantibacillus plantarum]
MGVRRAEIINGLRWSVVADALGLPAENRQRGTYPLITEMVASDFWKQPAGSWSDDTSMSLGLIENLVSGGDYDDLMSQFENYMRFGTNTPRGELFDIGRTCAHAIRNYAINQFPARQCGDPSVHANGNGALMYLAPLAVALQNDTSVAHRLTITRNYTMLTHGHARSVVASLIYLEVLHALHQGQALPAALVSVHELLISTIKNMTLLGELSTYGALFSPDFAQTKAGVIRTSGYVVDTLLAACWLALNYQTPREAVLAAVNFGGDTDTIATITAALTAAWHPDITVDTKWWQQTLNHKLLNAHFEVFTAKFASS